MPLMVASLPQRRTLKLFILSSMAEHHHIEIEAVKLQSCSMSPPFPEILSLIRIGTVSAINLDDELYHVDTSNNTINLAGPRRSTPA